MYLTGLRKYLFIAKVFLKRSFLPHIALSTLLLFLTPVIFGTANLDPRSAAIPLEMFVSLIGIVLLTPVFLPEQQMEIREVVESKYTGQNGVFAIRIIIAMFVMLLSISCFVIFMKQNSCEFDAMRYLFGTFASGLFLGSIGAFSYGISDNITIGYMAPFIFYLLNMFSGSKYLGKFYIFSLGQGSSEEKYWLFATSLLIIIFVLLWKSIARKTR